MSDLREKKRDKRPKRAEGVSDRKRDEAWKRIKSAAQDHGVKLQEKSWRELGKSSDRRTDSR
jgi:hypothetical protein